MSKGVGKEKCPQIKDLISLQDAALELKYLATSSAQFSETTYIKGRFPRP